MDNFNYDKNYSSSNYGREEVAFSSTTVLRNVYYWMAGALAISGLTAFYVATTPAVLNMLFSSIYVFYGIILAEVLLVVGLTAALGRLSALQATLLFVLYAVLNGVTLSTIFLVYEAGSIASTFFITSATFGSMAVYGSVTQLDLTSIGHLAIMGVVGIIIASLVNIFVGSPMLDLIISVVGVVMFVGLTAYDSQKIKAMLTGVEDNEQSRKVAIMGALSLYLDFVNLFLYLLRLMGKRR